MSASLAFINPDINREIHFDPLPALPLCYFWRMTFRIRPHTLVRINLLALAATGVGNLLMQVFCRPALWAGIVLLICIPAAAFYPVWRQQGRFLPLLGLLNGISACICVYCILFLGEWNAWALVLIPAGIGLLAYVPHFLLVQLVVLNVIRPAGRLTRPMFFAAVVFCLVSAAGLRILWDHHAHLVTNCIIGKSETVEPGFLPEKILGMHFIYHTRIEAYDGWRPPIHDPIVVIGSWGRRSRFLDEYFPLEDRIALYKRTFPCKPVKQPCSCALMESNAYHRDPRLQ